MREDEKGWWRAGVGEEQERWRGSRGERKKRGDKRRKNVEGILIYKF
jgi:hypothetical protein